MYGTLPVPGSHSLPPRRMQKTDWLFTIFDVFPYGSLAEWPWSPGTMKKPLMPGTENAWRIFRTFYVLTSVPWSGPTLRTGQRLSRGTPYPLTRVTVSTYLGALLKPWVTYHGPCTPKYRY